MPVTFILHTGALIDRPVLAAALVPATGQIMAEKFGSEAREWEKSYRNVQKDWDNYWRDLNISGEDSLQQWREGRWRVVKAWFRLTGLPYPSEKSIKLHLDQLPREIGRLCDAWKLGVAEGVIGLADQGSRVALLAPTLASPLVRGMAEGANFGKAVAKFIGPDELEQVGLERFQWKWLCNLAGGNPQRTVLVTVGESQVLGAATAAPPIDLSRLPELLISHIES